MIKSKATIAELRVYRDKILKSKTFDEARSGVVEMFYQLEHVFDDLQSLSDELKKSENRIRRLEHDTRGSDREMKKLKQSVDKIGTTRPR